LPDGNSWRSAFIGAIAAVVLSPLSLAIGYYSSKALSAPKLSIEYIAPSVETETLKLEKSAVSWPQLEQTLMIAQGPGIGTYDAAFQECQREAEAGAISVSCATELSAKLKQALQFVDFENNIIESDVQTISAWDGRSDLSITPIYLPSMGDPLEVLARQDKRLTINMLRDYEKQFADARKIAEVFESELKTFAEAAPMRTGKVTFRVGVLNSGDSDGVVFPAAKLTCQGSELQLRATNGSSYFGAAPYTAVPSSAFNVVRAHSFTEIMLEINDSVTPPDAQNSWRALVKAQSQDEFTIQLKTSGSPVTGKGRLPA
jgi:hypothetical protein